MKHFINLADLSAAEIWALLKQATRLRGNWEAGHRSFPLKQHTLGMVFQKPSLRTRVSFEVGMYQLGGTALYISPQEIGLGSRESVPDVARVLSRYVDAIMARTFAHQHIESLAEYATVPVINGLSDYNHPCQALADLLTIYEHHPQLEGLKLAYVGDGNNVLRSLLHSAPKLGISVAIATPSDYSLPSADIEQAQKVAAESQTSASVTQHTDPREAVAQADVIYTDVWTSMGQEAEREARLRVFPPYQINEDLVSLAKDKVLVMHCLPAHRGEEITDAVMDGPHSVVFQQAENRMHAQKSILFSLLAE